MGALLSLAPIRCKNFNLRQTFNNWQVFLFKYNRNFQFYKIFDISEGKEIRPSFSTHIVAFKICFCVTRWWHKSELSLKCANLCSLKFRGRTEERDMISQRCIDLWTSICFIFEKSFNVNISFPFLLLYFQILKCQFLSHEDKHRTILMLYSTYTILTAMFYCQVNLFAGK